MDPDHAGQSIRPDLGSPNCLERLSSHCKSKQRAKVLLDFSLIVKAATLLFISGCGSAISSAKEGKSGFIYNLVKR